MGKITDFPGIVLWVCRKMFKILKERLKCVLLSVMGNFLYLNAIIGHKMPRRLSNLATRLNGPSRKEMPK